MILYFKFFFDKEMDYFFILILASEEEKENEKKIYKKNGTIGTFLLNFFRNKNVLQMLRLEYFDGAIKLYL